MFGEKLILGLKEVVVDNKARILLPKFTYAEANEELIFYELNKNAFSIASLENLKAKLVELKSLGLSQVEAKNSREIESQIEDIYASIIDVSKVDKQRRITIPEFVRDNYLPFNYHEENGTVITQGYGHKVKVFLNTRAFIENQKEI